MYIHTFMYIFIYGERTGRALVEQMLRPVEQLPCGTLVVGARCSGSDFGVWCLGLGVPGVDHWTPRFVAESRQQLSCQRGLAWPW